MRAKHLTKRVCPDCGVPIPRRNKPAIKYCKKCSIRRRYGKHGNDKPICAGLG